MDTTRLEELRQAVRKEILHGRRFGISEWALAQIEELVSENTDLAIELAACAALLPGTYYMDPPDGGSPSISVQLRRMHEDLQEQLASSEARADAYAETYLIATTR